MVAGWPISDSTPPKLSAPGAGEQLQGRVLAAFDADGDHAAEITHLAFGDLVARMLREAGIVDALDLRLFGQPARQFPRVGAMPLHANGQGLDAAQHQPRVEGARDGAGGVLIELDRLHQLFPANHRAAHHIRMTAQVLRRTMDNEVGAELDRLLQIRRREGVIDGKDGGGFMGQCGDSGDVHDLQERVGRRLDPHHLGRRRDDLAKAVRAWIVGIASDQAPRLEDAFEQAERAAVEVRRGRDLIAGPKLG
jgi:hypothetical protein